MLTALSARARSHPTSSIAVAPQPCSRQRSKLNSENCIEDVGRTRNGRVADAPAHGSGGAYAHADGPALGWDHHRLREFAGLRLRSAKMVRSGTFVVCLLTAALLLAVSCNGDEFTAGYTQGGEPGGGAPGEAGAPV